MCNFFSIFAAFLVNYEQFGRHTAADRGQLEAIREGIA